MLTLPDAILPVLHPFATLFRSPTWLAQILLVGAILAPGQRTVAAEATRHGTQRRPQHARYHLLNRAVWSPLRRLASCRALLQHLGRWSVLDDFEKRRRGPKIKGIYRDAVRSSRSQVVKASGLRWISLMWLGPTLLGLALSQWRQSLWVFRSPYPFGRTPKTRTHLPLAIADAGATRTVELTSNNSPRYCWPSG